MEGFLTEIFSKCGLFVPRLETIKTSTCSIDELSITSPDISRIVRILNKELIIQRDRKEDFISELKEYLNNDKFLELAMKAICPVDEIRNREESGLSNLINHNNHNNNNNHHNNLQHVGGMALFGAHSQGQCLLRLLLKIEGLQTELISYLIERIVDVIDSMNTASGVENETDQPDSKSLSMRLLNLIRWSDVIYEPEVCFEKFLEVVRIVPSTMQIEMISSLPIIASDNYHETLIDRLKEIASELPHLVPIVLETFTHLSITPDSQAMWNSINFAKELLTTVETQTLPIVVRFLLEASTATTAKGIILAIREQITDFLVASTVSITDPLNQQQQQQQKDVISVQALIIDALRLAFQTRYVLLEAYLNLLRSAKGKKRKHNLPDSNSTTVEQEQELDDDDTRRGNSGTSRSRTSDHDDSNDDDNDDNDGLASRGRGLGAVGSFAIGMEMGNDENDNNLSDDSSTPSNSHIRTIVAVDIWVLFCIGTHSYSRTQMLSMCTRLMTEELLTAESLSLGMKGFQAHLTPMFNPLLDLAMIALSSNRMGHIGKQIILFGSWLYTEMYREFDHAVRRQEIVAALVRHCANPINSKHRGNVSVVVATSMKNELDAALSVLARISKDEREELMRNTSARVIPYQQQSQTALLNANQNLIPAVSSTVKLKIFAPFLKTLLEDVVSMSVDQIRAVFRIVFSSTLDPTSSDTEAALRPPDDVMILLKKFVAGLSSDRRRTAIIGYVAYMAIASTFASTTNSSLVVPTPASAPVTTSSRVATMSAPSQSTPMMSRFDIALQDYLGQLLIQVSGDPEAIPFLLDEIAVAIERGELTNLSLIDCLMTWLEQSIQNNFVPLRKDRPPPSRVFAGMQTSLDFDLSSHLSYDSHLSQTEEGKDSEGRDSEGRDKESISYVKVMEGVSHLVMTVAPSTFIQGPDEERSPDPTSRRRADGRQTTSFRVPVAASSSSSSSSIATTVNLGDIHSDEVPITALTAGLRCIFACQRVLNDDLANSLNRSSLESLTLTLGAPLQLPHYRLLDDAEALPHYQQTIICASFQFAIDWCRELLNVFTSSLSSPSFSCSNNDTDVSYLGDIDEGISQQLIERMNHLIELEDHLCSHTQRYPRYLSVAVVDPAVDVYHPNNKKKTKKAKIAKGKKKGGVTMSPDTTMRALQDDAADGLLLEKKSMMRAYDSVLRTLRPSVVRILGLGTRNVITNSSNPSSCSSEKDNSVYLTKNSTLRLLKMIVDTTSELSSSSGKSLSAGGYTDMSLADAPDFDMLSFSCYLLDTNVIIAFCRIFQRSMQVFMGTHGNVLTQHNGEDREEMLHYLLEIFSVFKTLLSSTVLVEDLLENYSTFAKRAQHMLMQAPTSTQGISMSLTIPTGPSQTQGGPRIRVDHLLKTAKAPLLIRIMAQFAGKSTQFIDAPDIHEFIDGLFHSFFCMLTCLLSRMGAEDVPDMFLLACKSIECSECMYHLISTMCSDMKLVNITGITELLSDRKSTWMIKLSTDAYSILGCSWRPEGGQTNKKRRYYMRDLGMVLRVYLLMSEDVTNSMSVFLEENGESCGPMLAFVRLLEAFCEQQQLKQDIMGLEVEDLPTVNYSTFQIFYEVCLQCLTTSWMWITNNPENKQLVEKISEYEAVEEYDAGSQLETARKMNDLLSSLTDIIDTFGCLVKWTEVSSLVKHKPGLLYTVLKETRRILPEILKSFDIFSANYERNRQSVSILLKKVQKITRQISHICNHFKVMKDSKQQAVKEIPLVKKISEAFMYRTKQLFFEHGEGDDWKTGDLKLKNVDGQLMDVERDDPIDDYSQDGGQEHTHDARSSNKKKKSRIDKGKENEKEQQNMDEYDVSFLAPEDEDDEEDDEEDRDDEEEDVDDDNDGGTGDYNRRVRYYEDEVEVDDDEEQEEEEEDGEMDTDDEQPPALHPRYHSGDKQKTKNSIMKKHLREDSDEDDGDDVEKEEAMLDKENVKQTSVRRRLIIDDDDEDGTQGY